MDTTTLIGSVAGVLGTLVSLPQAVKIYRSKSAKDVSWWTYILIAFACSLWTWYGFKMGEAPIYVTNIIMTLMATCVLCMKWRYNA